MLSPFCSTSSTACLWFFLIISRSLCCPVEPNYFYVPETIRKHNEDFGEPERVKNTLAHVCSAQHYYQACADYFFTRYEWPQPMPTGFTRPLPVEVLPSSPGLFPLSLLVCTVRLLMNLMVLYTQLTRILFRTRKVFEFPQFLMVDKRGKEGGAENIWVMLF